MSKSQGRMNEAAAELVNRFRQDAANIEYDPYDEEKRGILLMKLDYLSDIMTARAERLEKKGYSPDSDLARIIADRAITYAARLKE